MSFSGWYPSIGRSSDPNEEASSDDKYNVVSSDYVCDRDECKPLVMPASFQ